MNEKKNKKSERVDIRVTPEQKYKLELMAAQQKKSVSQLIVDTLFNEDAGTVKFNNIPIMEQLYLMSEIMVNVIPTLTNDKVLINTCREAVMSLWQYLK